MLIEDDNKEGIVLPPKKEGIDNAALFVSLYIVLLAFFIVLSSISKPNPQKMNEALESVSESFDVRRSLLDVPEIVDSIGAEITASSLRSKVKSIARDYAPLMKLKFSTYGDIMQLDIPINRVFLVYEEDIRDAAKEFLDKVAELMNIPDAEKYMEVEILVGTVNDIFSREAAEFNRRAISRATILAKYISSADAPKDHIVAGMHSRSTKILIMRFVIRDNETQPIITSIEELSKNGR